MSTDGQVLFISPIIIYIIITLKNIYFVSQSGSHSVSQLVNYLYCDYHWPEEGSTLIG